MSTVATWGGIGSHQAVGAPLGVGISVDTVFLRRARPADVPAIQALLDEYAARGLLFSRPPELLFRTVREYIVACDETGLVGCAGLRIHSVTTGEVGALAVADGPVLTLTGFVGLDGRPRRAQVRGEDPARLGQDLAELLLDPAASPHPPSGTPAGGTDPTERDS